MSKVEVTLNFPLQNNVCGSLRARARTRKVTAFTRSACLTLLESNYVF